MSFTNTVGIVSLLALSNLDIIVVLMPANSLAHSTICACWLPVL